MNAPLPIGQILIAAGLIGEDQLRIALHEQRGRARPLGRVLVELGFVSEAALRAPELAIAARVVRRILGR